MQTHPVHFFAERLAVLATMHHKESVIAPLLQQGLGLQVTVPSNFNTDQFGSFSREVQRVGTQLEAARRKAERAMQLMNSDLAIASEGSFGPHPALPYLPCNREFVVLVDHRHQLEIVGEALSTETNFSHQAVKTLEEAEKFAERVGFPDHGLIVIASVDRPKQTTPDRMIKGITTTEQLTTALTWAFNQAETAWLETDMRALYNPKRMQVIRQATEDLIQKAQRHCPQCGFPGFSKVEQQRGLPCSWCHAPTTLVRAVIYGCRSCGFRQTVEFPDGMTTAEPTYCEYCNP